MCGIAGILSLSPRTRVTPEPLRTMAGQLVHRGPDDEGYYVDPQGRCGLAFRRLSIIDVAGGRQPLANEDRTVWVIFNGEIYNYRELREQLQRHGHRFATLSDTEVIVHLYEQHGERCFAHLHGMFAVALWDERAGRLLLARDRLGKKPLTYAVLDDRLYFASEAKAVLALPGVPRELDPQSLHRYLLFQYVPAPHSIYRHFRKLPPGTYMTLAAGQSPGQGPTAFWRVPRPPSPPGAYRDARQRLGELLTAAVEKRLIADVPLGAFLSGGLDSSIVVGLMRKLGVSPLRTFSIGFPDPRYDERRYARLAAERFATEHHEHLVTPQAREVLHTLAWHYDEPLADSSAVPTYYLSRWTRQSVTVALTGDGGDEAFAGYDRYRAVQLAHHVGKLPAGWRAALRIVGQWLPRARPKSLGRKLHRFLTALSLPPARRYLAWMSVFSPETLAAGYQPDFLRQIDFNEPLDWFGGLYDAAPGPAANQAAYCDFCSYLPFDLLTKVDLASMACGLECRSPFLDHELVEFALSLPLKWRLGRAGGKRILKDWAKDLLPPEILRRDKMGFGVPIGEWFRGELRGLLEAQVLAPDALARRLFRPEWLETLVADHLYGRANHEHALWALLMLEFWRQRWQPTLS